MSNAMFSAKEALGPLGIFDHRRAPLGGAGGGMPLPPPLNFRPDMRGFHDPMGYIMAERLRNPAGLGNIPMPLHMFMPPPPPHMIPPPPFYGHPTAATGGGI